MKLTPEERAVQLRKYLDQWTALQNRAHHLASKADRDALAAEIGAMGFWVSHAVKSCKKKQLPETLKQVTERIVRETTEELAKVQAELDAKAEARRIEESSAIFILNKAIDADKAVLVGKGEVTKGSQYRVYVVDNQYIAAVVDYQYNTVFSAEFIEKSTVSQYI